MKLLRTIAVVLLMCPAAYAPVMAQRMAPQPTVSPSALATVQSQAAAALAAAQAAQATAAAAAAAIAAGSGGSSGNGSGSTSTPTLPTYDPGGNLCLTDKKSGITYPTTATNCPAPSGSGSQVLGSNGVPSPPTLVANAGPGRVSFTWSNVTANPLVSAYALELAGATGSESLIPSYIGQALTYQVPSSATVFGRVTATNAAGSSQSSLEASAAPIALPTTGTCAQLYAGLVGSGCGAQTATSVTPMTAILASYGDPVAFNTFMNWSAGSGYWSVHGGHASLTDWQNAVATMLGGSLSNLGQMNGSKVVPGTYTVGDTSYPGPKILSLPLVYHGPTGAPGELLASAAAGNFDDQYYEFGMEILRNVDAHQPINGQVNIPVRMAEEYNGLNSASNDWYMGGQESVFAAAMGRAFAQLAAAEAAYTPIAGHTKPHIIPVVCFLRDGNDPRPGYPPAGIWIIAEDNYVNHQYGDPLDPDADFTFTSTGDEWGLAFLDSEAVRLNKQEALPEWGVQYDDYGAYIKGMQAWVQSHSRFAYITYWNNNGGAYPGLLSDLSKPQTAAMFRHVFSPTAFPVEPLPYPAAISATGGNGTMTVTASTVPASANATTYLLYGGTAADGEVLSTPLLTASTPSFTFSATNNVLAFFKVAAGNAKSVGFLSGEAYDTPRAPPTNTPSYYVTMGASGIVSAAYQASYTPTASFCRSTVFSPATSDLTGGDHPFESVWGPDGYSDSYYWGETNGQLLVQLRDQSNNIFRWVSTGAILNVGSWYVGQGCYDAPSGNVTFKLAAAGSALAQIGLPIGGPANLLVNFAQTNPSTHLAPAVILGGVAGGGDHFAGSIANDNAVNGTTQVLNPTVASAAVNDNSAGSPAWTLSGGAAIHAYTP